MGANTKKFCTGSLLDTIKHGEKDQKVTFFESGKTYSEKLTKNVRLSFRISFGSFWF